MMTADKNRVALEHLIVKANNKTDSSARNLTDAVDNLIEGYGQGGGDPWDEDFSVVGEPIPDDDCSGSGADNSIVGTWVFNDNVSLDIAPAMFQVMFYVYDEGYREFDSLTVSDAEITYDGLHGIEEGIYEDGVGWNVESYKTITITEEPTDEAFITWLKENATKTETISIVGIWWFKPEISKPTFYNGDGDPPLMRFHVPDLLYAYQEDFKAIKYGSKFMSYSDNDGIDTVTHINVYNFETNKWINETYRKICITEEPTNDEFKTWLKENATKLSSAVTLVFRDDNIEDLPANAARGSVAILRLTITLEGEEYRIFNPEITIPEELWDTSVYFDFSVIGPESFQPVWLNEIYFWDDGTGFDMYGDDASYDEAYYVDDGWRNDLFRYISINSLPDNSDFISWLNENTQATEGITRVFDVLYIKEDFWSPRATI